MSEPHLGEIRMFAGNFAPRGWALCNGQLIAIQANSALFSLLGIAYGGNGTTNFALPNLQGSAPVHAGQSPGTTIYMRGEVGGAEQVALTTTEMPAHTHALGGGDTGTQASPANGLYGTTSARDHRYSTQTVDTTLNPAALEPAGSDLPHENRSPYLAVNFIIAVEGIFPARN